MNIKKILGALTILSILSLISLMVMIMLDSTMIPAIYVKSFLFNFVLSIVLVGFYAMHKKYIPNKKITSGIHILGILLIILAAMVSFNLINYTSSWNLLISSGIIYILAIQVALIGIKIDQNIIGRISLLLVITTNIFLALFFLIKWKSQELSIWIDITILISILSFVTGLIISKKETPELEL